VGYVQDKKIQPVKLLKLENCTRNYTKFLLHPHRKLTASSNAVTIMLMLYREIITCSECHRKHRNIFFQPTRSFDAK
jgi:hypothetical protein